MAAGLIRSYVGAIVFYDGRQLEKVRGAGVQEISIVAMVTRLRQRQTKRRFNVFVYVQSMSGGVPTTNDRPLTPRIAVAARLPTRICQ